MGKTVHIIILALNSKHIKHFNNSANSNLRDIDLITQQDRFVRMKHNTIFFHTERCYLGILLISKDTKNK